MNPNLSFLSQLINPQQPKPAAPSGLALLLQAIQAPARPSFTGFPDQSRDEDQVRRSRAVQSNDLGLRNSPNAIVRTVRNAMEAPGMSPPPEMRTVVSRSTVPVASMMGQQGQPRPAQYDPTRLNQLETQKSGLSKEMAAAMVRMNDLTDQAYSMKPPKPRGIELKELGIPALAYILLSLVGVKSQDLNAGVRGYLGGLQGRKQLESEHDRELFQAQRDQILAQAKNAGGLAQLFGSQEDDLRSQIEKELDRRQRFEITGITEQGRNDRFNTGQENQLERATIGANTRIVTSQEATKRTQATQEGRQILKLLEMTGALADPKKTAEAMQSLGRAIATGKVLPEVLEDPEFINAIGSGNIAQAKAKGQLGRWDSQNLTDGERRKQIIGNTKLSEARTAEVLERTREMPTKLAAVVAKANAYLDNVSDLIASRGWNDTLKASQADRASAKAILDGMNAGIKAYETQANNLLRLRDEIADVIQGSTNNAAREDLAKRWNALDSRYQDVKDAKEKLEKESKQIRDELARAIKEPTTRRATTTPSTQRIQNPRATIGGKPNWDANAQVQPYRPIPEGPTPQGGTPGTVLKPREPHVRDQTPAEKLAALRISEKVHVRWVQDASRRGDSKDYGAKMKALADIRAKIRNLEGKGSSVKVSRG